MSTDRRDALIRAAHAYRVARSAGGTDATAYALSTATIRAVGDRTVYMGTESPGYRNLAELVLQAAADRTGERANVTLTPSGAHGWELEFVDEP